MEGKKPKLSITKRRTKTERKIIASLIRFLTEYAKDASASNISKEQLTTVLDQRGIPHDKSLLQEAKWIFHRKVEMGEILLHGADMVTSIWERCQQLDLSQKKILVKRIADCGWLEKFVEPPYQVSVLSSVGGTKCTGESSVSK